MHHVAASTIDNFPHLAYVHSITLSQFKADRAGSKTRDIKFKNTNVKNGKNLFKINQKCGVEMY